MNAGREERDYVHRIHFPTQDPFRIGKVLHDYEPVSTHPNLISGWIHGRWDPSRERLGGVAEREITNIRMGLAPFYKSDVVVSAIGVMYDERPVGIITVLKGTPPPRGGVIPDGRYKPYGFEPQF